MKPLIDVTEASYRYWHHPKDLWTLADYADLTPPWDEVRVVWRVPAQMNVRGTLVPRVCPRRWSATLRRRDPRPLLDQPWDDVVARARRTADVMSAAAERGGAPSTLDRFEETIAALRQPPSPTVRRAILELFERARWDVQFEVELAHPRDGKPLRTLFQFMIDAAGAPLTTSAGLAVVEGPHRHTADELLALIQVVEAGVHPVLIALDALNAHVGHLVRRGDRHLLRLRS